MQLIKLSRNPFNMFVYGMFFHYMGMYMMNYFSLTVIGIAFCLFGWYQILYSFFFKMGVKRIPFKGDFRNLFVLYLFLSVVLIFRGYIIDYRFPWERFLGALNFHIIQPNYILAFVLPIFMTMGLKRFNFVILLRVNIMICVIFVFLFFFNILDMFKYSYTATTSDYNLTSNNYGAIVGNFYFITGFFVLLYKYIPRKIWLLNLFCCFLAVIALALGGRRGGVFMGLLLIISLALLYVMNLSINKKLFGFIVVIFLTTMLSLFYFNTQNSIFLFLSARGFEDTRSGVDAALLTQMNPIELVFGKGLYGRYYYPIYEDDYLNGWRYGSETGFFNLVLKGGYLTAIVYILVLLIPAIKGIFKSNNSFTKAGGLYIILSLIELWPFGWLAFNLKFLIIWMCVLLCFSPSVRKMNDNQIFELLFTNKKIKHESSVVNKHSL